MDNEELERKLNEIMDKNFPYEEIIQNCAMKQFEESKEKGILHEDFALILNPQAKGVIPKALREAGLLVPIVYSNYVEADKCYVMTDREFVENARRILGNWGCCGNEKNILCRD